MTASDLEGFLVSFSLSPGNAYLPGDPLRVDAGLIRLETPDGSSSIVYASTLEPKIIVKTTPRHLIFICGRIQARRGQLSEEKIIDTILSHVEAGRSPDLIFCEYEGDFACIIWSIDQRKAWFCVDPVGMTKLYYSYRSDRLVLSSHPKNIIRLTGEKTIDPTGLAYYLSLRTIPAPITILKGILKCQPGCINHASREACTTTEYWPVLQNTQSMYRGNYTEAGEELIRLLDASVEKCLESSPVPVGLFMSSGIDSVLLASLMKRKGIPFIAFTAGFEGNFRSDESDPASDIARALHIDIQVQKTSAEKLVTLLQQVQPRMPEPLSDAAFLSQLSLSDLALTSTSRLLDGTGADNLFGGMVKTRAEQVWRYYHQIPGLCRKLAGGLFASLPSSRKWRITDTIRKAQKFTTGAELPAMDRQVYWMRFLLDDMLRQILLPEWMEDRDVTHALLTSSLNQVKNDDRILLAPGYAGIKNILPWMALFKLSTITLINHSEMRVPYLSLDMVEFGLQLPDSFKVQGLVTKRILRDVARQLIPIDPRRLKKKNFSPPIGHWLSHEFKVYMMDSIFLHDFFNRETIEKMLQEQFNHSRDWQLELWTIFMFQIWWEEIQKS